MEERAQGALEYLLLIAGAVLVAAIVIVLLQGLATTGKESADAGGLAVEGGLEGLENLS